MRKPTARREPRMNNPRGVRRRLYPLCACLFILCAFKAFPSEMISSLGLPDGAKLRIGRGWTSSIAYSPDSSRIAVGGSLGVWIYDARFGKEIALLQGHTAPVTSAAYSPDGKRIVSASADKTVRVWDAETGKTLHTLTGHTDQVASAAYSPDSKQIVTASADKTIRIWDAETGKTIKTLNGHEGGVHSAAFSPDGRRIVSGSADKTVRVWDAETGAPLKTLHGHAYRVQFNNLFSGRHAYRQLRQRPDWFASGTPRPALRSKQL